MQIVVKEHVLEDVMEIALDLVKLHVLEIVILLVFILQKI